MHTEVRAMDTRQKLEMTESSIQKLLDDKRNSLVSDHHHQHDSDDQSTLLSQLEPLKNEESEKLDASSIENENISSQPRSEVQAEKKKEEAGRSRTEPEVAGTEEIVKELKKVQRQNLVTHCLLSVMLVLTVAWQLSEVSMILKVKDGLNHPFRSVGSLLFGGRKGPATNGDDNEQNSSEKDNDTS